jgi:hypothetical protein
VLKLRGKRRPVWWPRVIPSAQDQYGETYAPVAKIASVRVLLTWAAVHDLEIFQFDCKTAFLHAKLRHDLYARPFPGFETSDPSKVLRILVALYGLRQSAYEFYILFYLFSLILGWCGAMLITVSLLVNGLRLRIPPLRCPFWSSRLICSPACGRRSGYHEFLFSLCLVLRVLSQRLHIVDLGPCSKFLSILIIRDRPNRKIWLSSHVYVSELLDEWNLSSCKPASTPFPSGIPSLSPAPPHSLPDISDADLVPLYQRLVGCLLYLAIATRPDLSYYAMWLGQFNAAPTRAHFFIAKHVLRYLAGTKLLALCLGSSLPVFHSSLSCYMQNVGCSDADWASDAVDRKEYFGLLVLFSGIA